MKDSIAQMTRDEKINRAIVLIAEAIEIIGSIEEIESSILESALEAVGTDASPKDIAPDELGCAESVSNLVRKVLPDFPIITGTWTLYDRLVNDANFSAVMTPEPGDIIVSPTGSLANAPFPGHTGIVSDDGDSIMANDSYTGMWNENYTISSWTERWGSVGFPIYYFRLNA